MKGCYRIVRLNLPEPTAFSHEFQRIRFEKISRRAQARKRAPALVLTSGDAQNQTAPSRMRQRNFPRHTFRNGLESFLGHGATVKFVRWRCAWCAFDD